MLSATTQLQNQVFENNTKRDGISITLWVIQSLLAALFVFAGTMKFIMPLDQMVQQSSLPAWFLLFIGAAELAGGIGLIVPALLRIKPRLTPIAASALTVIMIGATVLSAPMGGAALVPALTGALLAVVAYGRVRVRPIEA